MRALGFTFRISGQTKEVRLAYDPTSENVIEIDLDKDHLPMKLVSTSALFNDGQRNTDQIMLTRRTQRVRFADPGSPGMLEGKVWLENVPDGTPPGEEPPDMGTWIISGTY